MLVYQRVIECGHQTWDLTKDMDSIYLGYVKTNLSFMKI